MFFKDAHKIVLCLLLILLAVSVSSCQPVEPQILEVTRVVQETVLVTQISEVIITAAPAATNTSLPTAMPTLQALIPPNQQTSQPIAQATQASGQPDTLSTSQVQTASGVLSGYCMPEKSGSLINSPPPSETMPSNGKPFTVVNGITQIPSPMEACTFVFNFGAPLPQGAKLEIFDIGQNQAWFSQALSPAPASQNLSLIVITHAYIINPPFWSVPYMFKVITPDGVEKFSEQVLVKKWVPEKCWNGEWPNPVTLECPIEDT